MKNNNGHFRTIQLIFEDKLCDGTLMVKVLNKYNFKSKDVLQRVLCTFRKEYNKIALGISIFNNDPMDEIKKIIDTLDKQDKVFIERLLVYKNNYNQSVADKMLEHLVDTLACFISSYLYLLYSYRYGYNGKNKTEMFQLVLGNYGSAINSYSQGDYELKTSFYGKEEEFKITTHMHIDFGEDIDGTATLQNWYLNYSSILTNKIKKQSITRNHSFYASSVSTTAYTKYKNDCVINN